MAKKYLIAVDNKINGDLLVGEIKAAHGIDISGNYGFVPPRTVEVAGFDAVDLAATIGAHNPPTPAPQHLLSKEEYRLRFLADERQEIELSKDANVIELRQALWAHDGSVNLLSDKVQAGVRYLESTALRQDGVTKILGVGRGDTILTA